MTSAASTCTVVSGWARQWLHVCRLPSQSAATGTDDANTNLCILSCCILALSHCGRGYEPETNPGRSLSTRRPAPPPDLHTVSSSISPGHLYAQRHVAVSGFLSFPELLFDAQAGSFLLGHPAWHLPAGVLSFGSVDVSEPGQGARHKRDRIRWSLGITLRDPGVQIAAG